MDPSSNHLEKACKFDAFISYRHTEPDKTIAERLQKMLEGYRAPSGVAVKYGIRKINRVFRDRSELPTSGNLSQDIKDALRDSRCLIVVCSPRTPQSPWCRKEIETFREMHGDGQVLALLIEGEPQESFPYELFYSHPPAEGAETKPEGDAEYEPLAADIRSGSLGRSCRLLRKTEVLRLIAPILGCEFADLKQRQKERRMKRVAAASTSVAALAVAVGAAILSLLFQLDESNKQLVSKNEVIVQKNDSILTSNSRYLADEATRLFDSGDRLDALMVGMEALPKDLQNPERPFVAEAENALQAIYNSDAYGTVVMDAGGLPVNAVVSPDGKYILSEEQESNNQRAFTVWDARNGRFLSKLKNVPLLYNNARFSEDSAKIIIRDLCWDAATGEMIGLYAALPDEIIAFYPYYGYISPTGKYWVELYMDNAGDIRLTDRASGKQVTIPGGANAKLVFFAGDGRLLVQTGDLFDTGSNQTHTAIYDSNTGKLLTEYFVHVGYSFTCTSRDNRYTALQMGSDMLICDTATMNEVAHLTDDGDNLWETNMSLFGQRAFFSNDGNYLAFQNDRLFSQLKVWDWKNNRLLTWHYDSSSEGDALKHDAPGALTLNSSYCEIFVDDPLFSPDDRLLLTVEGSDVHVNVIEELTGIKRFGYLYGSVWSKRHESLSWSSIRSISAGLNYKNDSNDTSKIHEIVLKGHTGAITSARFVSDNSKLITSSQDGTVRLWDTSRLPSDGQLTYGEAFPLIWKDIQIHLAENRVLAATQDTKDSAGYQFNMSNEEDDPYKSIALVDGAGKEIARLKAKSGYICKAFPQAGNKRFVTVSTSGVVDVWDIDTGTLLGEVAVDSGREYRISEDGMILAIYYGYDHTVKVLGGDAFNTVLYDGKLTDSDPSRVMGYSQTEKLYWFDGGKILGVVDNGRLYTFRINGGGLTPAYDPIELSLNDDVTPENRLALLCALGDNLFVGNNSDKGDSKLALYDMKTGSKLHEEALQGHIQQIVAAENTVLVNTRDVFNKAVDRLYSIDAATGAQSPPIKFDSAIRDIRPVPGGTVLVSLADGSLLRVDPGSKTIKPLSISIQNDFMNAFDSLSPDGRYVTLIDDKNFKQYVYDLKRESIIAQYFHADRIEYCADGSGYYVYESGRYFHCPFLTAEQLLEKVKQEIGAVQAELTKDQRKQYFID